MNSDPATRSGNEKHSFEDCPSCDGRLEYQNRADLVCQDCGEEFCHENRSGRHLLWSYTEDYEMDEIVARAGNTEEA